MRCSGGSGLVCLCTIGGEDFNKGSILVRDELALLAPVAVEPNALPSIREVSTAIIAAMLCLDALVVR